MADSSSSRLRIWEGWVPAITRQTASSWVVADSAPGRDESVAFADHLAARETLRPHHRPREGVEPYSLQWFLDIESIRHGRHGQWLPRLLEFGKHRGETLLGLGQGLGTDWVQYARAGAEVVACCPSGEHLDLIRRNFDLRGLRAAFLHAHPAALPLEPASIDVVCLTGLLHEVADPGPVIAEVYRVLKPGGKVLAVVPARYDIDFWVRCCFPWQHWFKARRSATAFEGVYVYPNSGQERFHAARLRQLFGRFIEPRVYKRHLRRAEVPHLWRWAPLPMLERLLGRFLVFKAFKPLSAAITAQAAA
jgi:SAM-dependent methyltransferase